MGYGRAITMPVSQVAQQQTKPGMRPLSGSFSQRMRSQAIRMCDIMATCSGMSCRRIQRTDTDEEGVRGVYSIRYSNGYKWVGDRRVRASRERELYVRGSLWLSFVYLVQWLRQPFFGRVRWLKQICLSLIAVVVVRCCSLGAGCFGFASLGIHTTPTRRHPHTRTHTHKYSVVLPASCYAPTKSQRFSRLVLFLVCLFVRVQIGYCDNTPHQRIQLQLPSPACHLPVSRLSSIRV